MSRMIFVNQAVEDLGRSVDFFTRLGFAFNPAFTDEQAACMVVNEHACVMLLNRPFFDGFHHKETAGPGSTETILCVSAASRQEVDDLCHQAFAAGARVSNEPSDGGFMYGWSFEDLDGHLWEVLWMDAGV